MLYGKCATGSDFTALLQSHVQTSEEATSFLPSLSTLRDPLTRKSAFAQIQTTVAGLAMDKTQITPAVADLVRSVVGTLEQTAFPPIIDQHNVDQESLHDAHSAFDPLRLGFSEAIGTLSDLDAQVEQRRVQETSCQVFYEGACAVIELCRNETEIVSSGWAEANQSLHVIDQLIDDHWCESGLSRTTPSFRSDTEDHFNMYNAALGVLLTTRADYEQIYLDCNLKRHGYRSMVTECSTNHTSFQSAECTLYGTVQSIRATYKAAYEGAVETSRNLVAAVMFREADRKVEWEVLTRVVCLLNTLDTLDNSEDGTTSSEDTRETIQGCTSMFVNTSSLMIQYPYDPDPVVMPSLPEHPCQVGHAASVEIADCELFTHNYDTVAELECYCSYTQESPPGPPTLPFYLLVDVSVDMTSISIDVQPTGTTWSMMLDGHNYSGGCQSVASDSVIGHPAGDWSGVDSYRFCYGAQAAAEERAVNGQESLLHRFLRLGGYIFLAGAVPVQISAVAPSSGDITLPMSTLTFGAAQMLPDDYVCEGGFHQVSTDLAPAESTHFCWQQQANDDCCSHGCFIFQFQFGKLCYPLVAGFHASLR